MTHNLDVSLLRAFVTVADAGGMTSASRHLNLTQAAVSQQVKRLEEAFDCQLFTRDIRGVTLTARGERLVSHARRLLRDNDEMWTLMKTPDFAGEVRLGMPSDLVRPYATPVLKRFDQVWPRVRVSLLCDTSGRLRERLECREIDMAVTVQPAGTAGGEVLLTEPLVWAGARGGQAFVREPLPVSTGDDTCPHRPAALKALTEAGRDWRIVCEVSSFEPICATVEADIAVSPLLVSTLPPTLQPLGDRSGLPALPAFSIHLHLPAAGSSKAALELADHIRDQLGGTGLRSV